MIKMTKWILLAAALLAIAGCSSAPKQDEQDKIKAAQTNTALGRQYMDRGQYEIALEKLKRAIAYDKTYAPAHSMLAFLYETIGETELADKEYRLAVQYDPTDGNVNNNYGAFLCSQGKPEGTDRYFMAAIDDPFYTTPEIALANAGSCALARGDLDKAESYLRQSLKYNDKLGAALLPMADVSYQKGSYLRARAFLQRYEAVAPMTEESLALGYQIETRLGDSQAARRYRSELMEQYPDSIQAGESASQGRE